MSLDKKLITSQNKGCFCILFITESVKTSKSLVFYYAFIETTIVSSVMFLPQKNNSRIRDIRDKREAIYYI